MLTSGLPIPGTSRRSTTFLAAVPSLARRLLIMGDLFDFWFEYRSVIPRRPFPTLARLAGAGRAGRRACEVFGGNHDRWGGSFWRRDLGIAFHRGGGGARAGRPPELGDARRRAHRDQARRPHHPPRHPASADHRHVPALHPDIGFWLADRLSGGLAEANRTAAAIDRAAAAQERYARALLDRRPELALVVMAHTHRQRLVEHQPGRWYLNAGQWMIDRNYAVVEEDRIRLMSGRRDRDR